MNRRAKGRLVLFVGLAITVLMESVGATPVVPLIGPGADDNGPVVRVASRDAVRAGATATLLMYFNHLYLSILFGKPTATLNYERYCVDEPESWSEIAKVAAGSGAEFWVPKCLPVDVHLTALDPSSVNTSWDARIRFPDFPGAAEFLARVRQAVVDPESIETPLLDEQRGRELSKLYGLGFNFFGRYSGFRFVKGEIPAELKRLGSAFEEGGSVGGVRALVILHRKDVRR